jgi:phosphoadenosine phosphosulfate reductase
MQASEAILKTIDTLNRRSENILPEEIIRLALNELGTKAVLTTSFGAEDQVLTDLVVRQHLAVDIITLDTGRLFTETLETFDRTVAKYGPVVKTFFPEAADVEAYVNTHGPNAFYDSVELRKECCRIRKLLPLERGLKGYGIWITGLRADQSENRVGLPFFEWDDRFNIIKVNPLLRWTRLEVMDHIHRYLVPYNPLHDKGFISIGCAPCTRAVEEGGDFRSGRWWWESSKKECGLHHS